LVKVFALALALAFLAALQPLSAVELRIQHSVIQKVLAQQLFTDEGRKYVRANRAAKCTYAYLENPDVSADNGRLKIRARFSGRSAKDFFGRCIGLGDSFIVAITATPYYRDGVIALKDVRVQSEGKDGMYIRRVRAALAQSLASDFSYPVIDDARRILEEKRDKAPYVQQLVSFNVSNLRVTEEALIVTLDFTLAVK
jgi:hypothetical protein